MNSNLDLEVIKGVRIIKRHSVSSSLTGILCIIMAFVPVVFVFLPWLTLSIAEVPSGLGLKTGTISMNGIQLLMSLFNLKNISASFIYNNAKAAADARLFPVSYYVLRENLIASGVWYALSIFTSLVLFFLGISILIRGRLGHNGICSFISFFGFVCNLMLFLDGLRLGLHLNYSIKQALVNQSIEPSTFSGVKTNLVFNYITMGATFGIFVVLLIIYYAGFYHRYYMEDIQFIEIPEPQPAEKNNGVVRNILPPGLRVIGAHAFHKNTHLEIAIIGPEVKELGLGAFSNCIRLKTVTIPVSVKAIHANCFYNCYRLTRINYGGTKEQWTRIKRGSNWLAKVPTTTVVCTDGAVTVNPYH